MDVDKDDSQISVSGSTVFISVPGKAARTIQSGEILGDNYELLDLLGKGGMGVVWRCRHLLMGHEYALKILSPHMVNEFSWKRFAIEGQVIAKLSHGNIVKIYNMGIYKDDCPFYVMELLSGLSLEEYVDRNGPLNNLETLTVALHLSEALAYAHSKGVIHRDLKPANIMLPENNAGNNRFSDVKIVDFGLAKLLGKQGYAGQSLTNAGDIFGSPLFMSPEQGMGGDIDVRSDIYSLGCTLFKLLTGEAPFYGANGFKTAMMHQKDPLPKLAEVAPQNDIAPVWQTIIEKMTAKNPAMRYQTMEQLHHDLQRVKAGKDITAYGAEIAETNKKDWREAAPKAPASAWWRSRAAVSIAVLATACGTIFAALNLSPKHRVIAPRAGPREISITSFALDPKIDADIPAADRHKIEAEYQAFQAKRSRISNVNGTRTALMYFPATSIGDVSNGRETVTAKNITQLQINKDGFDLILKASANRCTFDFPWILKKIDGNMFSSVNLDRASYNSAIGFVRDEGEKDLFDIDKIIEIVSLWPNLKRIDLDEFDLDGASGAMLDEATNLAGLYLKKSHVNEEAFRGRKFVNRLKILYLHESQNVDAALKYLSPQSALKMVQLDSTKPSVESLKNLSHCSQLQRVGLEQVPMSEAHWQALGQFHHLDILSLRHVPIDKGRLESLGCLTPDTKLVISDNCVAKSQVPALKHKFPNLAIFSERYSFGGSSMREIFIKGNHK